LVDLVGILEKAWICHELFFIFHLLFADGSKRAVKHPLFFCFAVLMDAWQIRQTIEQ
jgi:hypothetical protein